MLQFLAIVLGFYTVTLLIILFFFYSKLYINRKKLVIVMICSLYFVSLILFAITLVKDFLYSA